MVHSQHGRDDLIWTRGQPHSMSQRLVIYSTSCRWALRRIGRVLGVQKEGFRWPAESRAVQNRNTSTGPEVIGVDRAVRMPPGPMRACSALSLHQAVGVTGIQPLANRGRNRLAKGCPSL
jgi:hypothetical protein